MSLGDLLHKAKRDYDGGIACYRKAIEVRPKHLGALTNLGLILCDVKRDYDGAIACFNKALALDPKNGFMHYNLGNALMSKGQHDEAIACYKKAIELQPDHAEIHCNLGILLGRQGHFAESLASLKRGHELGAKRPGWRYPSAQWIREAEPMAALEAKLPAFLKGEFRPRDNQERLALAAVSRGQKRYAAAARLSAEAFAAEPKLAGQWEGVYRYNAACSAALASAGQGEDAATLEQKERRGLLRQALTWLRADLAAWRGKSKGLRGPEARAALLHWQKDAELACIRERAALASLSAEERQACERLWADVAALLKKAETPGKEGNP
jgi:hypothetical protein